MSSPLRPTRHRLFVAMGIATCCVAMSLAVLGYFMSLAPASPGPGNAGEQVLDVRIAHEEPAREAASPEAPEPPELRENGPPAELIVYEDAAAAKAQAEPPQDAKLAVDWSTVIADSARTVTDDALRENEARSAMWRQTRSVMFEPGEVFVAREPEPVLANFRFKPQVHVAGLGMTIGSCFIGIPLVGVPVEERSVAIRLFVCASESS